MPERPFLTAHWTNLLLLNFPVPTEIIARLAPPGTEPDTHEGQSYVSIVGFLFERVRVCGLSILGHTNFPEINLRYYVRREVGNEIRRGVVFIREIVPRRAVAVVANWFYNENYITPARGSQIGRGAPDLAPGDAIETAWRAKIPPPFREGQGEGSSIRRSTHCWNQLSARVAAPLARPP